MPYYIFVCQVCHEEFTPTLHMAELDMAKVARPNRGSEKVKQQASAFSAVTSKKS